MDAGLAGYFDYLDLLTLQVCLPQGSILNIETDGDVSFERFICDDRDFWWCSSGGGGGCCCC